MRGAVRFERPDLHLAEALTAELRLATQRLLRDQRVRAGRAGVDLVLHQVDELEHIDVADGHRLVEGLAGAAVVQRLLAEDRRRQPALGRRRGRRRCSSSSIGRPLTFSPFSLSQISRQTRLA